MNTIINTFKTLVPWRPLFWEPVSGTGERLMVGVIYKYENQWKKSRLLRDDVLDSLYGNTSGSAKNIIEFGLDLFLAAANVEGIKNFPFSLAGLFPGEYKETYAELETDILRTAALMYSSLVSLDILDDDENNEFKEPQPEEINKRFSTEIRNIVTTSKPEFLQWFNREMALTSSGSYARFGFSSPSAIIHFSTLRPFRQTIGVRDARARLWELSCASYISGIKNAALITGVPREDDPTIGQKQREQLKKNKENMEREADSFNMRLYTVENSNQAAQILMNMAS